MPNRTLRAKRIFLYMARNEELAGKLNKQIGELTSQLQGNLITPREYARQVRLAATKIERDF